MRLKLFFLCGVFSPLFYVAMTIVGGALRADYSHSYHAVSELLQVGAPNKFLMDSLLASSNLLGVLFGLGVLQLVRDSKDKRYFGVLGAWLVMASGILGLMITLFFPMDPRHVALSFSGLMHLVLVGVLSLLGLVTILFFAIWFKQQENYVRYSTYSFISAIIILVTGGIAAASAMIESPYMGLAERLTIAAHLQWTFFVALKMYSTSK